VFAVDRDPSLDFLAVLFLWIFFWEIGGQNIPNDWTALREDLLLEAQTVPVRFGLEGSTRLIFASLLLAVVMSIAVLWMTPNVPGPLYLLGCLLAGLFLLLLPAYKLQKNQSSKEAFALFNRASYYPLAMLFVVIVS
jgi:4-hydroxybenzoate polyprenyltransferase